MNKYLILLIAFIIAIILCLPIYFLFSLPGLAKPAIYLYPEKMQEVSVSIDAIGIITESAPAYNGGWKVVAHPDGSIDGGYKYLYYDITVLPFDAPKNGWLVDSANFRSEIGAILSSYGLNENEKSEFLSYWEEKLPSSKYYIVRPVDEGAIDKLVRLNVKPEPDTQIRLLFAFTPVDSPEKIEAPEIVKKERIGFTLVEWGGYIEGKK